MQNKPIVSIIIPVFNRALLLAATLDSIVNQTMADWECILVDDHSTDESIEIMERYQSIDSRFKIFIRPDSKSKGANSCRNFGFIKSEGKYVKWFDSDDIMLPDHLAIAYRELTSNNVDFVITDTINFDTLTDDFLDKPYDFDRESAVISVDNLVYNVIGWITDDFLGSRDCVKDVFFNESITDGDEYNFFIKLLHGKGKGIFINQILTYRRIHESCISVINRADTLKYFEINAILKFQTALDLVKYDNKKLIRWFLSGYMQYAFKLALVNKQVPFYKNAFILIRKYYSFHQALAFRVSLFLGKYIEKGYVIMKYARR